MGGGLCKMIGTIVGRGSMGDRKLVHLWGDAFGERLVEVLIASDKLYEEIDETEAVEDSRLAIFSQYQNRKKRLEGRISSTEGLEFL